MRRLSMALLAGIGFFGLARGALADDQPFHLALHHRHRRRAGEGDRAADPLHRAKARRGHAGIESNTEFEYGVTDDFQVSLYGNYDWEREHPHAPLAPAETAREFNVSGEAIYRFLNVYFDPVGFAVYLEPSYGANSRELEAKILLQKNFFNDDLRLAFNANFENQWERDAGTWHRGSAIEMRLRRGLQHHAGMVAVRGVLQRERIRRAGGLGPSGVEPLLCGPDDFLQRPAADDFVRRAGAIALGERSDAYAGRDPRRIFGGCGTLARGIYDEQGCSDVVTGCRLTIKNTVIARPGAFFARGARVMTAVAVLLNAMRFIRTTFPCAANVHLRA